VELSLVEVAAVAACVDRVSQIDASQAGAAVDGVRHRAHLVPLDSPRGQQKPGARSWKEQGRLEGLRA
jgi:hypothetical protein